jgi:hypothetical protein
MLNMLKIFGRVEEVEVVEVKDTLDTRIIQQERYLEDLKAQLSTFDQTVLLQKKIEDQETAIAILERDAQVTKDSAQDSLDRLKDEIADLKRGKANLENEHKMAEEDVKHLMKIHTESVQLEKEKFVVSTRKETDQELAKLRSEHQAELTAMLQAQLKSGDARFVEILSVLNSRKRK